MGIDPYPTTLPDLGAAIAAATHLDPVARAQTLRDLAAAAKSTLAAELDRAIVEACATASPEQVAEQYGATVYEINRRTSAHRKRIGQPGRRGRPRRTTQ